MTRILVVYESDYGSTEKMGHAGVEGINSVKGAQALLNKAEEGTADDFTGSGGVHRWFSLK